MIRFLAIIIMMCVLIGGCSNVDVYTFKKDRVDQGMPGNHGYVTGKVPPAPEPGPSKRTLIGIDIELDSAGSGSSSSASGASQTASASAARESGQAATAAESVPAQKTSDTGAKTIYTKSGAGTAETVIVDTQEQEEDWIK